MGARFGHDFAQVRVHEGAEASQAASHLAANAYTVGNDIVFGEGQYAPDTASGERLLAHELTHIVQHDRAGANAGDGGLPPNDAAWTLSRPSDAAEHEAASVADNAASGGSVSVQAAPTATVSRDLMDWVSGAASTLASDVGSGAGALASAVLPDVSGTVAGMVGSSIPSVATDAAQAAAGAVGGAASTGGGGFGGMLTTLGQLASGAGGGIASTVGGGLSDLASGVGKAATGAYGAYESATDFKPGLGALDQGVDWMEKSAAKGNQDMVNQTAGIPVLGSLAKAAGWLSDETTQATGGVVKGLGDIAGGLGNLVAHPLDSAAGMEGILEHNATVPFMGSTLKGIHGAYDLVANGGGQYGNSWGSLANHVLNPLQSSQDDGNYDLGLAKGILAPGEGGWQTWADKPAEAATRALTNIAPMLLGGGEGEVPGELPGKVTIGNPLEAIDPMADTVRPPASPHVPEEVPPESRAPDTIPQIPAIPRGTPWIEDLAKIVSHNPGTSIVELLMKKGFPVDWV